MPEQQTNNAAASGPRRNTRAALEAFLSEMIEDPERQDEIVSISGLSQKYFAVQC